MEKKRRGKREEEEGKRGMKLLCFVDTHASRSVLSALKKKAKEEKPDALVCAGDFTVFGRDSEKELERLRRIAGTGKLFLVHGNHEEESETRKLAKQLGCVFLHKQVVVEGDMVLVGWGGGGFSSRDRELDAWVKTAREKVRKRLGKRKGKKVVVVAHAPFYGTPLDEIYGSHLGSKSLTALVKAVKADYAVCGHFHENAGKQGKIRQCAVVNPGPKGWALEW